MVKNTLVNPKDVEKGVVYQISGEDVTLSPDIVRKYLVSGNGEVSSQELVYFINLCKYQKLNPFTRECYLIKYGNQPATIVTSISALLKRAMRNPRYAGHLAGVVVRKKEGGELEHRVGAFVLPDEDLIGGWSKVYVKGYEVPMETAVSFEEYEGKKADGSTNAMWKGKPGVMIRKVALATGLREAFPEDLSELYAPEEIGEAGTADPLPQAPIEMNDFEPTHNDGTEQQGFEDLDEF